MPPTTDSLADEVALQVQLRCGQNPVKVLEVVAVLLHQLALTAAVRNAQGGNARLAVSNARASVSWVLSALAKEPG